MKYYTTMLYESVKGEAGFKEGHEFKGNRHTKGENLVGCQNDTALESASKASEKVSKMVKRAPRTVMRDVAEVKAVREAGKLDEYNAGKLPKKEIKEIVDAAKPVRKQTSALPLLNVISF